MVIFEPLFLLFPAVVENLPHQEHEEKLHCEDPDEANNQSPLGVVNAQLVVCLSVPRARIVDPVVSEEQDKEHHDCQADADSLADRDAVKEDFAGAGIVGVDEHHDEQEGDDELACK